MGARTRRVPAPSGRHAMSSRGVTPHDRERPGRILEDERRGRRGTPKLKLLPIEYVEIDGGVLLKRGRLVVKIGGARAAEVVRVVLAKTADGDATREQIAETFAAPDRVAVIDLVEKLSERRILVEAGSPDAAVQAPESSLDVFYWHFGERAESVNRRIGGRIAVVGVNCVARQIALSLRESGVENVDVIHYPLLCNLRLFDERGRLAAGQWPSALPAPLDYREWKERLDVQELTCLVGTSDFGGLGLMRPWNEFCVKRGRHFLPCVLQDSIGYVGPLVVPGETACFECLRARQNSNMADPEVERAARGPGLRGAGGLGLPPGDGHRARQPRGAGAHPVYGRWAPPTGRGHADRGQPRRARPPSQEGPQDPALTVCSPLNATAPVSADRDAFLPGHEWRP